MIEDGFKNSYTTIPFAYYRKRKVGFESGFIHHNHKELELIAMVSGSADFYIDTVHYQLSDGDVLVIPPYAPHRARVDKNSSYECVCFDLSLLADEEIRNALEGGELTVSDALRASEGKTLELNKSIINAVGACEENAPGWELYVVGALSFLFAYLKRIGFFVKSERTASHKSFSKSVIEYVESHYTESISSGMVAEKMFLNNSYFCRLFKSSFGCTFAEYLLEYRIERAKLALNNTKAPISDIAIRTGFNSFSYFSKMFKRLVGKTPTAYRGEN